MPLPQVNDRLKEIPAQALRTVFATIGQLLLAADRLRARAAEQLSGGGEAAATPPAQQAPAETPRVKPGAPRTAPVQDAETTRWRSLDKTGNVRLLDGDEEQDEEDLAVPAPPAVFEPPVSEPPVSGPAVPEPAIPEPAVSEPAVSEPAATGRPAAEPVAQAAPEAVPAPAGYTPTEPVPAVSGQAEPVAPGPALDETAAASPAGQAPPDVAPVPDPAGLAPAVPAPAVVAGPPAATGEALPVPHYDQLSVASLRARLRMLDAPQVQVLLDYEKAHEGRPAVITMFERRLTKLSEGS